FIGATTENPYFEVNNALISRSTVFRLFPLTDDDIKKLILRCIKDEKKGLGMYHVQIHEDALEHIVNIANGDARTALNALELAVLTTEKNKDGEIVVDLSVAEECIQRRAITYEKKGEYHYDTISAFIKSMRGSDPDAVLHYLAKMLYAGEDPVFIARRIVICASEDVGLADSNALQVAVAASQAVQMVGMPEARIPLAHAAVYVANAPKSNSAYMGINKALEDVEHKNTGSVPLHLRNNAFKGAAEWGYGKGYKYAHEAEEGYVELQFLPDAIKDVQYYKPKANGDEARMKEVYEQRKRRKETP
ncbi:MAG: ATPase, partial [Clostridia bacterium]|nr:ATPase [Clostridia bacterium]